MSDWRAKNAVYLVTVPETFQPERPWDLPDQVVEAELYAKNLALVHVLGFCRTFNSRQLRLGLPDRKWALAIKHTRFRWDGPRPAGDRDEAETILDHTSPEVTIDYVDDKPKSPATGGGK